MGVQNDATNGFVALSCKGGRGCGDAAQLGEPFRVEVRSSVFARMRGLLGRARDEGAGYTVLVPCCDIHTCGMSEPIDVAFVDSCGVVVSVHRRVAPSRRLRFCGACLVLERLACTDSWFEVGDQLFANPCVIRKPSCETDVFFPYEASKELIQGKGIAVRDDSKTEEANSVRPSGSCNWRSRRLMRAARRRVKPTVRRAR